LRIFQVDAFTRHPFTGNPATVVLDADSLPEESLGAIAREFAHAETAFVSRASAADHDVRLRFWNARKEAPFVGHATLAAHAVMLAVGRRSAGVIRQHSGTGIIEVRADGIPGPHGASPLIEFRQSAPELLAPLPEESTLRIAEALQLPAGALHAHWPARIARKGGTRLLVPVAEPQALTALAPRMEALVGLGAEIGADGFFVFACVRSSTVLTTQSRMFCPALGIPEDPVSGNAHGMLAAYLLEVGELGGRHGLNFVGHQGTSVRRPGEVRARVELDADASAAAPPVAAPPVAAAPLATAAFGAARVAAVHIGGHAVIVSEGRLNVR
jgi:PhzF family phenazine biosynthesis protein